MLRAQELTPGERLFIARRRSKRTKAAAAAVLDVTLYRYSRWEDDLERAPRSALPSLGRLGWHEGAAISRRRAGVSLEQAARAVGVSPWWLSQIEGGQAPVDRLREFLGGSPWRPARRLSGRPRGRP